MEKLKGEERQLKSCVLSARPKIKKTVSFDETPFIVPYQVVSEESEVEETVFGLVEPTGAQQDQSQVVQRLGDSR